MSSIVDDYLREVAASLKVGPSQRERILDELRGHILEKANDLQNSRPDLSVGDAQRQALRDFGDPHELALSFDPEGPTLENSAGRTVLRIGQAVGRGTGRVIKGVAWTLGVLLVVAIALGIWAFYEVRPVIADVVARNAETDLYDFHEHCQPVACAGDPVTQSFFVHEDARELRFHVRLGTAQEHDPGGSVRVVVAAPDGSERFNRSLSLVNDDSFRESLTWAPVPGDWTVRIAYADFSGILSLDVEATGLPPGSVP